MRRLNGTVLRIRPGKLRPQVVLGQVWCDKDPSLLKDPELRKYYDRSHDIGFI